MKTTNHSTEGLEAKLLSRFGTETPFTIPEGYFDGLTDKVMSRVTHKKRRNLVWRWVAAAMLAGSVITGGLFLENQNANQTANTDESQYIEDVLYYSMIDNMSIASYLIEAE